MYIRIYNSVETTDTQDGWSVAELAGGHLRAHPRAEEDPDHHRQEDYREGVEDDGQGGQPVREPSPQPEEQPPVHPGHPPRHLPAPARGLQALRGERDLPERERVLQDLHGEPNEQVQADGPAVQGLQGEDIRRDELGAAESHEALSHFLSHVGGAEGLVPQWGLRRVHL